MSGDVPEEPAAEIAILRLQSSLDVGLTGIRGQLDLILQRLDQQDRRADDHAGQITAVVERVQEVERTAVTRQDLERERRRTLALTGVIVSVVAVLVPSGISVLALVVV